MEGENASIEAGIIDFGGARSSSSVDLTDQVHQLPCCIKYNGLSPVSHHFKPKSTGIEVDGLNVKEAYFRGRKLQGTAVPLPDEYSGFVIGKKSPAKRKTCNSDATTLWNHDDLPSKEDGFLRVHWFDVAKTLHKPTTAKIWSRHLTLELCNRLTNQ